MFTRYLSALVFIFGGVLTSVTAIAQYADPIDIYTRPADTSRLQRFLKFTDSNNNGYTDISIRQNYTTGGLAVTPIVHDGYGTFTAQATGYSPPESPVSGFYQLADINGDDVDDILYLMKDGSGYYRSIVWHAGDGAGSYAAAANVSTPAVPANINLTLLGAADFDLDGAVDVAAEYSTVTSGTDHINKLVQLKNDGSGNFTSLTTADIPFGSNSSGINFRQTYPGDYDGDGDKDLGMVTFIYDTTLSSYKPYRMSVVFIENLGNGQFSNGDDHYWFYDGSPFNQLNGIHVSTGDLTNDGRPEIFVQYYHTSYGGVSTPTLVYDRYAILSFNNTDDTWFTKRNAYGYYHDYPRTQTNPYFYEFYGDVNHDGNDDMLVYKANSTLLRWNSGDGNGNFSAGMTIDDDFAFTTIPVVYGEDVDQDGDLDVFVLTTSGGADVIKFYENLEFEPDYDSDGFDYHTDCDDHNELVGDTLLPPVLLDTFLFCGGESLQLVLDNDIDGVMYSWTGPGGYSSAATEPVLDPVAPLDAGTYNVAASTALCTSLTSSAEVAQYPNAGTQIIVLNQGWNLISGYINPMQGDLESLFSEILDDIVIVKNAAGQVFLPGYFNQIGDWDPANGYQVKLTNAATLELRCTIIDPADTPVDLTAGWNIVSYLRNSPLAAATAWAGIADEIIIAKDADGSVFMPGFLDLIGDLEPGQGYWIKLANPAVLTYPGN